LRDLGSIVVDGEPPRRRLAVHKVALLTISVEICNIGAVVHLDVRQADAKAILGEPDITIQDGIRLASNHGELIGELAGVGEQA
jgi:hypothetical protein